LSVDLTSIGQLERQAIERVHEEITPYPESADDLHDLLCSLLLTPPRVEWQGLFDELVARGRAQTIVPGGAWCATEMLDDVRLVAADDDAAIVTVVRGHLELAGITTDDELAATCGISVHRVRYALAVLEQQGVVLQGRYTPDHEVARAEWVSRRLLARMHSYSRNHRRRSVEGVTAQDFVRFELRWQHLAPDTQLSGEAGLATIVGQLQGWEAAAAAWEPELFGRRLRQGEAAALDRLCHDGEVTWLRLSPRSSEPDAPIGGPSKATPISVLFRDDLGWLLEVARWELDPVDAPDGTITEVADALRVRGACFASELCEATGRPIDEVERALWGGVARGLLSSDGFNAIRHRVDKGATNGRPEATRLSRLMRGARPRGGAAGRWSLVPATSGGFDRDELAEATAELLLRRWGVIFRDLAQRETLRLPWRDIQRALRRLEDRGLVRGGRFVSGFAGEQYALPEAIELLSHVRKAPRTGERVTVNATDPCNLVGIVVEGPRVASIRAREVTYVDGIPQ
jgi:ATP-dependent Lhr-like helicase